MTQHEALTDLRTALIEIQHLGSAAALLSWDQETYMPKGGVAGRAAVLSSLSGQAHEQFTAAAIGNLLDRLEGLAEGELSAPERALVREVRRDFDRSTRVPTSLVRELAEARSTGLSAWQEARGNDRFDQFAPHLSRLVELKQRVAEAIGGGASHYDTLLDEYEPGATQADLETLFGRLTTELQELLSEIVASDRPVDTGPVQRAYDPATQRAFAEDVIREMGFDLDRGRIDRAAHPFCSGIHPGDVRLTWRSADDDLRPALFGLIHEAGHGLYEQGLPAEWNGTPLGEATSLGVHESQSRLWENMIARSLPFWRRFLPVFQGRFPGLADDVDADAMFRAVNEVRPSFIRVEADELTYNLHIALRFQIEKELFAGALSVDELPDAWNEQMETLLGIRPETDADGVLQDIHWAMGAFGYFPTYTLGNLYAAQLLETAKQELGSIDELVEQGEFGRLRQWLADKIFQHGRRYTPRDLIREATGKEPSPDAFLDYARDKFRGIYGD